MIIWSWFWSWGLNLGTSPPKQGPYHWAPVPGLLTFISNTVSTFYEYKVLKAADGLAVTSTACFSRGLGLISTTYNTAHNCLGLEVQKISYLLMASSSITCRLCTDIQADKTCKIINNSYAYIYTHTTYIYGIRLSNLCRTKSFLFNDVECNNSFLPRGQRLFEEVQILISKK